MWGVAVVGCVVGIEIPAFAGMSEVRAGMTEGGVGSDGGRRGNGGGGVLAGGMAPRLRGGFGGCGGGVRAGRSLWGLVAGDQVLHLLDEPGYVSKMEIDVIFSHLTFIEVLVQLTSCSKREPEILVARFGNDTAHYLD